MSPIALENLTKNYGSLCAVNQVSLEMREGEILGLLGPNGAGKTTIISVLTTLEAPTSGHARVFGHDVTKESRVVKSLLGLVPQEIVSHGFFSIEEVLEFTSGYHGIGHNKEWIEYLLKKLALWEHRKKRVLQLSGGMKRRFLIAKALLHKPKLLLLDEPTAGVDIELRNSLWAFVRELHKEGTSILLTTHYLEEAEHLCDRVAVINKGVLKKVGPTSELIRELTQRKLVISLRQELSPIQHKFLISQSANELVFQLPSQTVLGDFLQDLSLEPRVFTDLKIEEGSLEDAVMNILGDQG